MSDIGLPLPEFTLRVRNYPGVRQDAERMQGRFARHVLNAVSDGLIPAQRRNGRWFVRPELAGKAAEILGILPHPAPMAEEGGPKK